MANFEDESILYWNQRGYKRSVSWYPKTNTGRLKSAAWTYQYHIFMATIKVDLHHQELGMHVCYQAPKVIPPEDQDAEVSIIIIKEREKSNGENITNLVGMTPDKPPEPRHVIESNQRTPGSRTPPIGTTKMVSEAGTLTLQQD